MYVQIKYYGTTPISSVFEGDFWSPTSSRMSFDFCCAYLQDALFNVYSSSHFTSEPIVWHLVDNDLPWFPFWNYVFQCVKNNKHSKFIASNCNVYLKLICEQLMQKNIYAAFNEGNAPSVLEGDT